MTKNKIILLLLLLLLVSCSTVSKQDIVGTYKYQGKISNGSLTFTGDGFTYEYEAPMHALKSAGKWELKGKQVILKSADTYNTGIMQVTEKEAGEKTIIVVDAKGRPYGTLDLRINGVTLKQSDQRGIVPLSEADFPLKTIELDLVEIDSAMYKIKSANVQNIVITIIPKDFTKFFFNNQRVDLKQDVLVIDKQRYVKIK